jgi:hypothetical protein
MKRRSYMSEGLECFECLLRTNEPVLMDINEMEDVRSIHLTALGAHSSDIHQCSGGLGLFRNKR